MKNLKKFNEEARWIDAFKDRKALPSTLSEDYIKDFFQSSIDYCCWIYKNSF